MEAITSNLLFGLLLSLIAFEIGLYISRKFKLPILNPLLIAILIVISVLLIFNIDFDTYNEGAKFINVFLGPATVVLAVPLYKQINLLKKHAFAIISGIFIGSLVGLVAVTFFGKVFSLDITLVKSLLSKSVTTPIGIEITKSLDGIVPITVLSIVISGILGAIIGPPLCKFFKIKNSIAVGVSLGTASHAVGTTKALELGETEGAMSSLSIGIAGLITVFLIPLTYNFLFSIFF